MARTNGVTCSPPCARARRNAQCGVRARLRYANDPDYRAAACADSAAYRKDKSNDAVYLEKERKRSARRMREKRRDPAVMALSILQASAYQREKRRTDPEYRNRDNARRTAEYRKARDDSARQLLDLLNAGRLPPLGNPCFVYQFYDASEILLYVGITNDPKRRLYQHARDKDWFGGIAVVKLTSCKDETEAMASESFLIKALRPLHNIRQNGGHFLEVRAAELAALLARFVSVDLEQIREAA